MTIAITQKVKYSADERLDLNDKLAEDSLLDTTLYEWIRALIEDNSADGRVIFGWKTSTVVGPNGGFTIAAAPGLAFSRDGAMAVMDGGSTKSVALTTNAINYIHAHFDEADSDSDDRRFINPPSTEETQTTDTRITRTAGIHKTTTAYGGGTPSFSGFAASAVIGGNTRQLVPLYAVAVDGGDNITGVFDYRPLFAMSPGDDTDNLYGSPSGEVPDFPHDFSPADAPTLGIVGIRSALVAIADRLQQVKGTTNWYDDGFTNIIVNGAGGGVYKSVNDDVLTLSGGSALTNGANIELYGGTHATLANQAFYDASKHTFRSQDGTTGSVVMDPGSATSIYRNVGSALSHTMDFYKSRGTYASPTIVSSGDSLGVLDFYGYGTAYTKGAIIEAVVDGTPSGTADMPTRIVFSTSADGSGTPTERLRISSTGLTSLTGTLDITSGLSVGFVATPGDDEVQVGDANFKMDWQSATVVALQFDSTDSILYTRNGGTGSIGVYAFQIGSTTEFSIDSAGVTVTNAITATDTSVTHSIGELRVTSALTGPAADDGMDLGASGTRWNTIYGNTLNIDGSGTHTVGELTVTTTATAPSGAAGMTLGASATPWGISYLTQIVTGGYTGTVSSAATGGMDVFTGTTAGKAIVLRSSGVAHGMTSQEATDVFGTIAGVGTTTGGMNINGYNDSNGRGVRVSGNVITPNTTTGSGSRGVVEINADIISGTGTGTLGASDNAFSLTTSGIASFTVKGDHSFLLNTTLTQNAYDDEQDAVACQDLAYVMAGRYEKVMAYAAPKLERLGIMSNGFMHTQKLWALQLGAIGELYGVLSVALDKLGLDYETVRRQVRMA